MTPEQRYLFDINGYLHLPGVLSADELAAARAAFDRCLRRLFGKLPSPGAGATIGCRQLSPDSPHLPWFTGNQHRDPRPDRRSSTSAQSAVRLSRLRVSSAISEGTPSRSGGPQ